MVESKSFEIVVEETGRKLREHTLERGRGFSLWIRVGDVSLQYLLKGVEVVVEEGIKFVWSSAWVEEGRQYRLECKASKSGSFLLCSEKDSSSKTHSGVFHESKGLVGVQ